jgi:peptidoglycan/LPS O-acetylase OafA/YrhL
MPALTGMRIFAALLVVVYHFGQELLVNAPWPVRNLAATGHVGVSLFFILSGFILMYSYEGKFDEPEFPRRFLAARLARIYPLYALSLLVSAPMYLIGLAARNTDAAFAWKALVAAGSRFTLMHAWSGVLLGFWNIPSWSLSVEWFFYLVFALPFAATFARRWRPNLVATAVGLWLIAVAVGIGLWLLRVPFGDELFKFNPLAHLAQFAIGVCIAKAWLVHRPAIPGPAADAIAVATVGVLALSAWVPAQFIQFGGLAFVFGPLIVAFAGGRGLFAKVFSTRPLVFLGEASYGVYILHWPIMELCLAFGRSRGIAANTAPFFLSYLAITLVVSSLSFEYVEVPARDRLRKWLLARTKAAPVSAVSVES